MDDLQMLFSKITSASFATFLFKFNFVLINLGSCNICFLLGRPTILDGSYFFTCVLFYNTRSLVIHHAQRPLTKVHQTLGPSLNLFTSL